VAYQGKIVQIPQLTAAFHLIVNWAFYARKQLLLSGRFSHRNSVCSSVCLSHGWISQKRCKLRSPNLYRQLPGRH